LQTDFKNNAVLFWHSHIGQHLNPDLSAQDSVHAFVPTKQSKAGVAPLRLGAGIDAGYIVSGSGSYLIGKVVMPDAHGLTFVNSEEVSFERFIARWLADKAPATEPWMIGVIGKANAQASMQISAPPGLCYFCQNNAGFSFDLNKIRKAIEIIGGMPWKAAVATSLHGLRKRNGFPPGNQKDAANENLLKLFTKYPGLNKILSELEKSGVKAGSGEYQVLSWYFRER
jgi:hypothetical protein